MYIPPCRSNNFLNQKLFHNTYQPFFVCITKNVFSTEFLRRSILCGNASYIDICRKYWHITIYFGPKHIVIYANIFLQVAAYVRNLHIELCERNIDMSSCVQKIFAYMTVCFAPKYMAICIFQIYCNTSDKCRSRNFLLRSRKKEVGGGSDSLYR